MQFVVSYPKSGNTWIRLVTAAYALEDVSADDFMHFDKDDESQVGNVMRFGDRTKYHYQAVSPFPIGPLDFGTEVRLRPAAMMLLERDISETTTQRPILAKSHHLNGDVDGINLWNPAWTDRVVNPVRDPREVCCSFAAHLGESYEHTARIMNEPKKTLGSQSADGEVHHLIGTWSQHVRGWLSAEKIPVHTVRYEDMRANPVKEFYDIFDFLNAPDLTVERVENAVRKTSFDRLQKVESEHEFTESMDHQDKFFRSGKTDGWKGELPVRLVRKIEKDHGDMMNALGYGYL
ncbi:sulfotransferase domain-containing protein [Salinibacter ruber]|uniref:sulfotransferase domain-containing protein n=1 Tax=Salinibacter ruber TaxID=146919 RepID=UPI0020749F87|nr:sulfotransferase domain-containing protein [Salinibacter ruber]